MNESEFAYQAHLIFGGDGDDRILAGSGDDTIWGGAGDDTIVGDQTDGPVFDSSHADIFLFASGHGNDVLEGFSAEDILDLSPLDAGFSSLEEVYAATEDATPVSDGYNFALLIHTSATDSILLQFAEEPDITALTIVI